MQMSDHCAPARVLPVGEPYRRIWKTTGYAGGKIFISETLWISNRVLKNEVLIQQVMKHELLANAFHDSDSILNRLYAIFFNLLIYQSDENNSTVVKVWSFQQ